MAFKLGRDEKDDCFVIVFKCYFDWKWFLYLSIMIVRIWLRVGDCMVCMIIYIYLMVFTTRKSSLEFVLNSKYVFGLGTN